MKDIAVNRIRDFFDDLRQDKKTLIKILFVVLILMLAAVLRITGDNTSSIEIETAEAAGTETEDVNDTYGSVNEIWVDIGGQVKNPGVYQVNEGTRLYELIDMAGGLTENADTDSINRASYIEDGEKIIIPRKSDGSEKTADGSVSAAAPVSSSSGISSQGLVNINLASKEELKTLNGIGDVTADKIIEYRESNRFKKKEDIKSVKGIGDAIYEKIKDNITC